jgi:hypothetical protein
MKTKLDQVAQRPRRYWFEDGLTELISGGLFLLIGVFSLVEGLAPPQSEIRRIAGIAGLITMIVGPWLARPMIRRLKERLTYPRTGYVSYRQPKKSRRAIAMIVALIVAAAVVWILMLLPGSLDWIPLIEGAAVGTFLFYQGQSFNLTRFYILATLAAALGVGLSIAGIGNLVGMGLFFSVMSIAILLSGGLTLHNYIDQAPPPVESHS